MFMRRFCHKKCLRHALMLFIDANKFNSVAAIAIWLQLTAYLLTSAFFKRRKPAQPAFMIAVAWHFIILCYPMHGLKSDDIANNCSRSLLNFYVDT